jgi:hypothetical protein
MQHGLDLPPGSARDLDHQRRALDVVTTLLVALISTSELAASWEKELEKVPATHRTAVEMVTRPRKPPFHLEFHPRRAAGCENDGGRSKLPGLLVAPSFLEQTTQVIGATAIRREGT